jgi:glycosyltransferase involved in cell wall biosynthesis
MVANETSRVEKCISVVITTFNDEDTIMPVLLSLLFSGVPSQNIQLIIVDGGSTDNTLQLIEGFLNKYGNVFRQTMLVTHHRNLGVSKARNDGIKLAQCEYVLLLDSDIVLPQNALKIMVEYLQTARKKDPRIAGVKLLLDSAFPLFKRLAQGKIHRRSIGASETLLIVTNIIRQFMYDESLGPPFSSDEDIELGARLLKHGYKIHMLGNVMATHLKPPTSLYIAKSSSIFDGIRKSLRIVKSYYHSYTQKGFYKYYMIMPLIDKLFYLLFIAIFILIILMPLFIIAFLLKFVMFIFLLMFALIVSGLIYEAKVDLNGLFNIKQFHIFLSYYFFVIVNRALRFSSMLLYCMSNSLRRIKDE